jgi:hypothetical protein
MIKAARTLGNRERIRIEGIHRAGFGNAKSGVEQDRGRTGGLESAPPVLNRHPTRYTRTRVLPEKADGKSGCNKPTYLPV